jgi:hypothetical protein
VSRSHKGTINLRYLAPPFTVVLSLLSVLLGVAVDPIFFIPAGIYFMGNLAASIAIGKNIQEKIVLPAILATMHFSWGAGFLTSPKKLVS